MTITWVFAHKRSIKAPNCWPITVRLLGLPFNNQRFILAQQLDLPPSPHPPTFQRTFKKTILGRSKTRPLSTPFDDLMLTQSRTRNGRVSNEGQGGPGRARRSRNASGSLNPASGSSNPGLRLLRFYIYIKPETPPKKNQEKKTNLNPKKNQFKQKNLEPNIKIIQQRKCPKGDKGDFKHL